MSKLKYVVPEMDAEGTITEIQFDTFKEALDYVNDQDPMEDAKEYVYVKVIE